MLTNFDKMKGYKNFVYTAIGKRKLNQ